jgi:hypothetical protein
MVGFVARDWKDHGQPAASAFDDTKGQRKTPG